ncbi:MAG: preprotein translocase subunit SecE [Rhodospirillales bacterium]|nr:preprotein translocase subunit SecE [Rhodospirillales bacterium]MDG4601934.1 preprotein translocase subunit SecE [Defluviicoccus sp.]MDG4608889.1 preprotein translocase subunit SecE [Defluviicoccus sp.]
MAKINIAQFVREVRQETAKVTWPTRRETALSTAMVMLMVVVAAIFFLVVDQLLAFGVRILLGI